MPDPIFDPATIEQGYMERRQRELDADTILPALPDHGVLRPGGFNSLFSGAIPEQDKAEPGWLGRAMSDVSRAFNSGQITYAPLVALDQLLMSGIEAVTGPVESFDKVREKQAEYMDTATGGTAVEIAKGAATGGAGVVAGGAVGTAMGLGKFGMYLSELGGGMMGDFTLGAVFTDPKQANLANLGLLLGNARGGTLEQLAPVFEYLAVDPETDSELEGRLKNGAVEALTNVVGEGVFALKHLGDLKDWIKGGGHVSLSSQLKGVHAGYQDAAQELIDIDPALAGKVYGPGVADISQDLAAMKGAGTYAAAMDNLEARAAAVRIMDAKVTPAEARFFEEIISSPADFEELATQVPSFTYKDGRLSISEGDMENLMNYLDDTVILQAGQGGRLPPRFYGTQKGFFGSFSPRSKGDK